MVPLGDEAQVEARFGPFGDSANLDARQIVARFASNIPQGQKSFWKHPMGLQGDVGHVESRFFPFGDSVNVGARQVHGLIQMFHRLRNHFGRTRWYDQVTRLNWKLISVPLDIVLILMQDRSTVCVERAIGSEIVWTHPMNSYVTWVMWNPASFRLETVLVSVQDRCMVCTKCTIGS